MWEKKYCRVKKNTQTHIPLKWFQEVEHHTAHAVGENDATGESSWMQAVCVLADALWVLSYMLHVLVGVLCPFTALLYRKDITLNILYLPLVV